MSIIHDALKKAQGQEEVLKPAREKVSPPHSFQKVTAALEEEQEIAIRKRDKRHSPDRPDVVRIKEHSLKRDRKSIPWVALSFLLLAIGIIAMSAVIFIYTMRDAKETTVKRTKSREVSITPVRSIPKTKNPYVENVKVPQPDKAKPTNFSVRNVIPGLADKLTCNGIFYEKEHPVAFVNGSLVGVGDSVGDAEVVSIHENKVILRQKGRRIVLYVT